MTGPRLPFEELPRRRRRPSLETLAGLCIAACALFAVLTIALSANP